MDRTRWIIFGAICVLVLGGLVIFSKKDQVNVSGTDPATIVADTATSTGDHVLGNKDSKVVVYEYGDYQCPYCGQAYPQVTAITDAYQSQVAFVFRNFPLTTIHPNALSAATAAEAAGLQGKYWEMYNKLYETQDAWSTSDTTKRTDIFTGYAKELGIDPTKFKDSLSDPKVSEKINRDRAFAKKLGVDSTPTFYIGSQKVDQDTVTDIVQSKGDKLRDKIDAALKAADVTLPARS